MDLWGGNTFQPRTGGLVAVLICAEEPAPAPAPWPWGALYAQWMTGPTRAGGAGVRAKEPGVQVLESESGGIY